MNIQPTRAFSRKSNMERLMWALKEVRFVAYAPSRYNPLKEGFMPASESTIVDDLQILRPHFDGLISYSCSNAEGLDKIVPIADTLQYQAAMIGIWDITSEDEINTAICLAKRYPSLIAAVIVGNEGLLFQRYDYPMLERTIQRVRGALPNIAVTTSENIMSYGGESKYGGDSIYSVVDFHAVNIHPWFEAQQTRGDCRAAVDWVKGQVKSLKAISDKPILIHETGLPSGPEPYASPEQQAEFWEMLLAEIPNTKDCGVAFFEAFDSEEWKMKTNPSDVSEVEIHWGAFTNDRKPKPVVKVLS